MDWLVASVVLSVVLTVGLNLALRAWPGAGDRLARRVAEATAPRPGDPDPRAEPWPGTAGDPAGDRPRRRTRVLVPWRAMIMASLALTVLLNLLLWLR